MAVLLDTHVLVWLLEEDLRFGPSTRALIDRAVVGDRVAVSALSFWETAVLVRRGRCALIGPVETLRRDLLVAGVAEIPVTGDIAAAADRLAEFHRDPADRMITATALLRGLTLITADRQILAWPGAVLRHDARP